MAEGQKAGNKAQKELRESGKYSDLKIVCGESDFAVHKAIVCPRSAYFAIACEEGRWKEGEEGVINLQADGGTNNDDDDFGKDDPEAVKLMVDFLYLHDYDVTPIMDANKTDEAAPLFDALVRRLYAVQTKEPKNKRRNRLSIYHQLEWTPAPSNHNHNANVVMHAKVYALGSKYAIDSLQAAASRKFREAVVHYWNHEDFVKAINIVFTTTPESDKGLRKIVTQTILAHPTELAEKPEVEECIRDISNLAFDLFKAIASGRSNESSERLSYWC